MCGATVAAPVAVAAPNAPERVLFTLRPAFLFVGVRYAIAAVLWLIATALVAAAASMAGLSTGVGAIIVLVVGVVLFASPVFKHIDRQRNLYTLTTDRLEIEHGILSKSVRSVPISKIQDVTVSASIVQRLLGLGDIRIDNASEAGGGIVIRAVPEPKRYADALLAEMRRRN